MYKECLVKILLNYLFPKLMYGTHVALPILKEFATH